MPVVGPDEWRRVDNLFQAALDHTPAERAVFLAKACAGDDQLRQTVAGLLASFEEAGGFLETPAALDLLTVNFLAQTPEKIDLPPDPVVKRRLGHFEILSKLGAGGMGEVYLAHDIQLDRRVALKILPAHFSTNPQWAKRFEREARAASTLNHPNIITIYEIGREGPINYIAAEFIDGHTLRRKIGGEKLAVREAVTIAVQMAGALGAAHAAGVVHRDVKPENVMVRPDGLVKVLDFGLAKPIAGMTHETDGATAASRAALGGQTDPECLMGTIHYLSPEQILKREVDHRTDIFSFGVVLYEMVAGQRPFTGPGAAAVCGAILRSAPPPIGVSHNLQRIIGRALAKDRESRYQTADEMRDDLQRFLHETDAGRVGRHGAKRWIKFALACVGMLVAVAALVLAPRMRRAGGHEAERPRFSIDAVTRITDTGGQEIFPSLSPDGGSVLYASRAAGNWDIYLRRKGERQVHNLTSDSPGLDLAPTFSPDGKRIAFH
ncbi:MAG TPA: protein kinase, partial [Pyrinomonadaceae bacterium]|nr:protein kinase [Pyrinomonadaceae bacterium]